MGVHSRLRSRAAFDARRLLSCVTMTVRLVRWALRPLGHPTLETSIMRASRPFLRHTFVLVALAWTTALHAQLPGIASSDVQRVAAAGFVQVVNLRKQIAVSRSSALDDVLRTRQEIDRLLLLSAGLRRDSIALAARLDSIARAAATAPTTYVIPTNTPDPAAITAALAALKKQQEEMRFALAAGIRARDDAERIAAIMAEQLDGLEPWGGILADAAKGGSSLGELIAVLTSKRIVELLRSHGLKAAVAATPLIGSAGLPRVDFQLGPFVSCFGVPPQCGGSGFSIRL